MRPGKKKYPIIFYVEYHLQSSEKPKWLHSITARNAHALLDRLVDTEHTYCSRTHIDSLFCTRILYWVTLVRHICDLGCKCRKFSLKKTFILHFVWAVGKICERYLKTRMILTSKTHVKMVKNHSNYWAEKFLFSFFSKFAFSFTPAYILSTFCLCFHCNAPQSMSSSFQFYPFLHIVCTV